MFFFFDRICALKAEKPERPHSSHKILFPITSSEKRYFYYTLKLFCLCIKLVVQTHLTLNCIVYYILMSPSRTYSTAKLFISSDPIIIIYIFFWMFCQNEQHIKALIPLEIISFIATSWFLFELFTNNTNSSTSTQFKSIKWNKINVNWENSTIFFILPLLSVCGSI